MHALPSFVRTLGFGFGLLLAPEMGFAQQAAIGSPAPPFALPDTTGTVHQLSDYAGRVVVLEWTNPGCPFIVRHYEAGTVPALDARYDDSQVVVLSIDSSHFQTAEGAAAWKAERGFAHSVLLDTDGSVGRAYGARTTPHMFVIDAAGVLQYMGAIDDDPRGSLETRTPHVQHAVDALLAGQPVPVSTTQPYGCTVKYED
jgi:peroxiredoxin